MRKNRLLILLAFMTVSVCACSSKVPEENEMKITNNNEQVNEVTEKPIEVTKSVTSGTR